MEGYYWEIIAQTFGKFRLIYTDGVSIDRAY